MVFEGQAGALQITSESSSDTCIYSAGLDGLQLIQSAQLHSPAWATHAP